MRPAHLTVAVVLVLHAITPARAAIIVFADRGEFLAAAGSLAQQGFESLAATNDNTRSTIAVPGASIVANGHVLGVYDREETGAHATDGANYLLAYTPSGGFVLDWELAAPVNAVGFDVIDFESGPSSPLTFSYVGGSYTAADTTANGAVAFFGIIDTERTFTAFQLNSPNSNAGDGVGFDRISFGVAAVPEPSSLISAALGLAGLAGYAAIRRGRTAG